MANSLLQPQVIASTGLALLERAFVLPNLVSRLGEAEFRGKIGDTINFPIAAKTTARRYSEADRAAGRPIVLDELAESSFPIKLDTHSYNAIGISDEDLTLKIRDFGTKILNPQVKAVASDAEGKLLSIFNGVTGTLEGAADGSNVFRRVRNMRKRMNDRFIPAEGRILAVSSEVEAAILEDKEGRLVRYEQSGDAGNPALRNATIGRLYGFEVVLALGLTPGTAVGFTSDAFAFAVVPPEVPAGVSFGQAVSENGVAMRWIRDYDAGFTRDRSIVSTFVGASVVDSARIEKLTGVTDPDEDEVETP